MYKYVSIKLWPGPPAVPNNQLELAAPDPPGTVQRSWEIAGFRCRGGVPGPTYVRSAQALSQGRSCPNALTFPLPTRVDEPSRPTRHGGRFEASQNIVFQIWPGTPGPPPQKTSGYCRIPNCHEIVLELVCGADFWCNRNCRTSRVVLEGFWGPSLAENRPKTGKNRIPSCQ